MKQWFKKNWWLILIIFPIAVSVWFIKPSRKIIMGPDTISASHRIDSIIYIKKIDSMKLIIEDLNNKLFANKETYKKLIAKQKVELNAIKTIPDSELIKIFEQYTGSNLEIQIIGRDTNIITKLPTIEHSVVLFVQNDQCSEREFLLVTRDSIQQATIEENNKLLRIKDDRIMKMTQEFYNTQQVINSLNNDLTKEKRQGRNKNIAIGILIGVATAATVIAITR